VKMRLLKFRPLLAGLAVGFSLSGCEPPAIEKTEIIPQAESTSATESVRDLDSRQTPVSTPVPTATPTPTPVPDPTPLPNAYIPYQRLELSRLFSGIRVKTKLTTIEGDIASKERVDPEAYTIEMDVKVRVPKASSSLAELASVNPKLPAVLPGLEGMMTTAKVSDFYHALYDLKTRFLHQSLQRLDRIISVHNFFDAETVLELTHPETGRRALLVQSEMDVVTDGSDGDRYGAIEVTSESFQPFTSYSWAKKTATPNPFLAGRQTKLAEMEKEFSTPGLSIERNRELKSGIEKTKRDIYSLLNRSFLIAEIDPFIVLPGFMMRDHKGQPFKPAIGDYAVVIFDDTIYPAIVGDAGPSYKSGEASLRICRELEPRASGIRRAVNDLTVTYLVFPGTADKPFAPPDLAQWKLRVTELLTEIGGHGGKLFDWPDLLAKPDPSPTPSPLPGTSPLPQASATPFPVVTPAPIPRLGESSLTPKSQ